MEQQQVKINFVALNFTKTSRSFQDIKYVQDSKVFISSLISQTGHCHL